MSGCQRTAHGRGRRGGGREREAGGGRHTLRRAREAIEQTKTIEQSSKDLCNRRWQGCESPPKLVLDACGRLSRCGVGRVSEGTPTDTTLAGRSSTVCENRTGVCCTQLWTASRLSVSSHPTQPSTPSLPPPSCSPNASPSLFRPDGLRRRPQKIHGRRTTHNRSAVASNTLLNSLPLSRPLSISNAPLYALASCIFKNSQTYSLSQPFQTHHGHPPTP